MYFYYSLVILISVSWWSFWVSLILIWFVKYARSSFHVLFFERSEAISVMNPALLLISAAIRQWRALRNEDKQLICFNGRYLTDYLNMHMCCASLSADQYLMDTILIISTITQTDTWTEWLLKAGRCNQQVTKMTLAVCLWMFTALITSMICFIFFDMFTLKQCKLASTCEFTAQHYIIDFKSTRVLVAPVMWCIGLVTKLVHLLMNMVLPLLSLSLYMNVLPLHLHCFH